MNYTIKLLIPIGLGLLAGFLNWLSVSNRTRPVAYTTVNKPIRAGETIATDDLKPLPIPADIGEPLKDTAVPFSEKGTLSNQVALRDLEVGDILFWRDTPIKGPQIDWRKSDRSAVVVDLGRAAVPPLKTGDSVDFYLPLHGGEPGTAVGQRGWVGPFRLVTVGRHRVASSDSARSDRIDQVTVAFPRQLEEKHRLLQQYLDRTLNGEALQLGIRIVNDDAVP